MNNYTTKNLDLFGRVYMVEKTSLMNSKQNYKRWKALMSFTDISVDPQTSMIYASDAWWKKHELVIFGAMDGTNICIKLKPELQEMYCNRHDHASLNIMHRDHAMILLFWAIAQQNDPNFPLPPLEKYYLFDSGYPYISSRNGVVRYHISHFNSGPSLRNKQELFNRYHVSLRSVIVRSYGVWKKKWRILSDFLRYDIHVQKKVVMATMRLHNFFKISNFEDADYAYVMTETGINNRDSKPNACDTNTAGVADREHMVQIRDNIADMLWKNQTTR
ncbi:unnamed protein product, partial [Thlaspi arvense]